MMRHLFTGALGNIEYLSLDRYSRAFEKEEEISIVQQTIYLYHIPIQEIDNFLLFVWAIGT